MIRESEHDLTRCSCQSRIYHIAPRAILFALKINRYNGQIINGKGCWCRQALNVCQNLAEI